MNKSKLLSLVTVFVALSSTSALAKGKTAAPVSSPSPSSSSHSSDIQWGVSGPFALIDGNAYFGGFVTGDYFVTNDISVGGESGFLIGSVSSVTIWEIPIVVTGKYHFAMAGAPSLRPFAGLGLGLGILHGGASATIGTTTISASATSAKFHGELQLGTAFQDGPGLMAELRIGMVDSGFLLAPSIGWNF